MLDLKYEKFLDLKVPVKSYKEMLEYIGEILDKNIRGFSIASVNPEICVAAREDSSLREAINRFSIGIPDGNGIVLASKIQGGEIKERITGIDLMLSLCDIAQKRGLTVFLLGAAPKVAREAEKKLVEKFPKLKVCGTHDGYFKFEEQLEIVELIRESETDILFVGLGSPRQEAFIDRFKGETKCRILMPVGGSFDVISGNLKRAPKIYIKLGLEWLYRAMKEPKRAKRLLKLPQFLVLIIAEKFKIKEKMDK